MQADDREIVGYIFRPWIRRNGRQVWAREYGLKAWRIPIYRRDKRRK